MKRNRLCCLAIFAASSPVTPFGNAFAGLGRALLFASLAIMGAAWSTPTAQAQGVTFAGAQTTLGSGFSSPPGVAVDGSGNVFVADTLNSAVKEILAVNGSIPANPTIKTLGSGFSYPVGVAVDNSGNVFVADTGDNAVKEIPASCIAGANSASCVRTLGGGFNASYGVAVDNSGNVYVVDSIRLSEVYEIPASCIAGANNASCVLTLGGGFYFPSGVAVDGRGNVYVADTGNNAVKEIPTSCIAGANNASCVLTLGSGFSSPEGVAVDGSGNVFVADTGNTAVKEIPASCIIGANNAGCVLTLGSGFNSPRDVAVDGKGNVFVADDGISSIVELQMQSVNFGSVNVCPSGQTTPVPCSNTLTLSYDVDANTTKGSVNFTTIGSVNVLTLGAANLDFQAQAADTSTTLCEAETYSLATTCTVDVTFAPLAPGQRNGAVQIVDGSGNILANTYIYGTGVGPAIAFSPSPQLTLATNFDGPSGIARDASGDIFVADAKDNAVKEILAVNGSIPANPTINTLASSFASPEGVAVDGSGNVFVADMNNNAVKEIVAVNGSIPANPTIRTLGSGFINPIGQAVDGNGNVFVADSGRSAVYEILAVNGSIPANPTINTLGGGFNQPNGVAVDGSGNVYVADEGHNEVKEILAVNGSIPASNPTINILGSDFSEPTFLAVDASGDVYVTDTGNAAVKEIVAVNGSIPASNPTINTLGGGFNAPLGIALDGIGNVYVLDDFKVFEIQRSQPPSLSFASTIVGSTSSDSPKSAVFQNIGNQPLTGDGTLTDTTDFIQILGTSSIQDCSYDLSLNTGAECNLSISFTPQSADPLSGTLTLSDNALNGNPATQTIQLGGTGIPTTTTTLMSSLNPSVLGQPVTFTATVTPTSGPAASGTVSFEHLGAVLATKTLSNGVASFTISTLPLNAADHIIAVYSGSAADGGSTSPAVAQTVNRDPTTTVLTSSLSPSVFGQPVTFTATVSPAFGAVPSSGTVSFEHLGAVVGTGTLSSNGVASFTTSSPLPVGTDHIIAVYSGSTTNTGSTSAAVAQTVNKAPTTTTLTSSANPSVLGQPVTFTATVTPTFGPTPTGTVRFEHLGALVGMGTLNSSGVASFTTSSPLPVGTDHIIAVYSGSTTNIGSTSTAVAQTVH